MKLNFEGSSEEFRELIGQAMLNSIRQLYQQQPPAAFSHREVEPQYSQPQPQPHYQRVHLPALPPPSQQPIQFASYPASQSQPQIEYATTQTATQPASQSVNYQSVSYPATQSTAQQGGYSASQLIPQPFVPQSCGAIVPTTPAEIVPTSVEVDAKSAGLLAGWLRSLKANIVSRLIQSPGLMLVACVGVFGLSAFAASKIPFIAKEAAYQRLGQEWSKPLSTPTSSPTPTASPVPTIQASPKPVGQSASKSRSQSSTQLSSKSSSQPVVDVPCLPLPVTQKGC